jgi:hypothetical protein
MQCASVASTQTLAVYEEVVQRILFLRRIESLLTTRIYEGDKADLSLDSRGTVKTAEPISQASANRALPCVFRLRRRTAETDLVEQQKKN